MSSNFFVTKLRFLIFFFFFLPHREKKTVLCTNSNKKFFTYAQDKRKVAQAILPLFG